jgi:hypothetical protein
LGRLVGEKFGENLIKCKDYPVIMLGKPKDVFVRDSWGVGSNPNDIMTSLLERFDSKLGKILVEEEAQSV